MKKEYTKLYVIMMVVMIITIAYQSIVIVNQQSNICSMQEDIKYIKQKYNAINKAY